MMYSMNVFCLLQIISTLVHITEELANIGCNSSGLRGIPDVRRSQSQIAKVY